jgi:SPP1 gp7 family putative phage head morphogenesis protein
LITLRPQHLTSRDTADIERQLKRIFWQIIFAPVVAVIEQFTRHPTVDGPFENASDVVIIEAIREGRVQYLDGVFSGQFSAAIGRELRSLGAAFDKRSKVYRLDTGRVPAWVRAEASSYQERARRCHEFAVAKLNETQENLNKAVDIFTVDPTETLSEIEKGFQVSARALTVMPSLSQHSKENLAAAYTQNMKLWIKDWSNESIEKLRGTVQLNAQAGYRFASLAAGIKQQYGVSASKAKFLAGQETRLFMANYRQERFTAAGVNKYRWSSSHDVRVRHDHRKLDGRIFSYDDPPVVDEATQRKGNPGTDYGCRCVDIPVVGRLLESEQAFKDLRTRATPEEIVHLKKLGYIDEKQEVYS